MPFNRTFKVNATEFRPETASLLESSIRSAPRSGGTAEWDAYSAFKNSLYAILNPFDEQEFTRAIATYCEGVGL